MGEKKEKLLLYLYHKNNWIPTQPLASLLNVSIRTIRNYIAQLNEQYPNIIFSSNEGYQFNKEYTHLLNSSFKTDVPQTALERIIYLLNLLLKNNYSINFFDLCEELYISESTLKTDLRQVKKRLYEYDLELINENNELRINGIEKNKRKLLSKLLYEESNSNFLDLKTIEQAFPNIDITFINKVMIQIFSQYHWFINDYSKINILLHTTIAVDRLKSNKEYTSAVENRGMLPTEEYKIASDIGKLLSQHFHIPFETSEIYELSLLISSYTTNINFQEATLDNIQKIVGHDCYELCVGVIEDMNQYFYINLNEPQFFIRFALHIYNLLKRIQNGVKINNPLAVSIKERCPMIYDCAVAASHYIYERIHFPISDDEIGYIAFHIGGALETQKKISETIKIALLFPQYYNLDKNFVEQIEENFKDDILIKNVIASEETIDEQDCDLVLSTIPVNHIYNKPIILISPFLQKRDFDDISTAIKNIKHLNKKNEFSQIIDYMMQENLFFINKEFNTREDTIQFMANTLERHGYVDSNFQQKVLEREQMSSTAFGKVAIPHAMKMSAKKSGMCVILNDDKHKLTWGDDHVNIVLMLSISKDERKMFIDFFEAITNIFTEDKNIIKLISTLSYDEFKKILIDL